MNRLSFFFSSFGNPKVHQQMEESPFIPPELEDMEEKKTVVQSLNLEGKSKHTSNGDENMISKSYGGKRKTSVPYGKQGAKSKPIKPRKSKKEKEGGVGKKRKRQDSRSEVDGEEGTLVPDGTPPHLLSAGGFEEEAWTSNTKSKEKKTRVEEEEIQTNLESSREFLIDFNASEPKDPDLIFTDYPIVFQTTQVKTISRIFSALKTTLENIPIYFSPEKIKIKGMDAGKRFMIVVVLPKTNVENYICLSKKKLVFKASELVIAHESIQMSKKPVLIWKIRDQSFMDIVIIETLSGIKKTLQVVSHESDHDKIPIPKLYDYYSASLPILFLQNACKQLASFSTADNTITFETTHDKFCVSVSKTNKIYFNSNPNNLPPQVLSTSEHKPFSEQQHPPKNVTAHFNAAILIKIVNMLNLLKGQVRIFMDGKHATHIELSLPQRMGEISVIVAEVQRPT